MSIGAGERATQLWGSIHAQDTQTAVNLAADIVGPELALGLPDGETGDRQDWIIKNVKEARYVPGIKLVREGDLHDYDSIPEHRVDGPVDSWDINLGYRDAAVAAFPYVSEAAARIGRPDLKLWVGVAEGKQLPTFLFGERKTPGRLPNIPLGAVHPKLYRPYVDATNHEIVGMYKDPALREGIITSIESPGAAIGTLQAWNVSSAAGKLAAHKFARDIVSHVGVMPSDAEVAVHLCWGRFQGEAFASPNPTQRNALVPLVWLANEVADQWPETHQPPALIGLPLTAEGTPAPQDIDYYRPLRNLDVDERTRVGAGIITPQSSVPDLARLVPRLDELTDHIVVPMAPCGLSSLRHQDSGEDLTRHVLEMHRDIVGITR